METTFKAYDSIGITTETTVFTCPTATQTTITAMSIANTSGNDTKIDVKRNDAYMIKQASIAPGQTLVVVGSNQKVVVEESGTIKVTADNSVDVIVSTLEIS